jgi:ATP-dependent DNA helicase RecG
VYADVNLKFEKGKQYLEIIVPRYDVPISLRGKYYIRSGSTLQELKGLALNEFILKRTGKTWDDIPEQRANLEDLDEKSVKQFVKDASTAKRINIEDGLSLTDLLQKLRLLEDSYLKRAAIILFGKDPGKFFPNLAVKIGKFGESDADLKFHEVVEGNLIQLKSRIVETLNAKFFISPIDFIGMQRVERDEYPVAAIREMIFNSLVHRNYMGAPTQIRLYDNSFSIWNDGSLPDGISEEDLWKVHRSKPRNPLLADICFKAGYIDAWGRGTIKIIESCRQAGLPDPVLKEEQGGFFSKLFKDQFTVEQYLRLGLNDRQVKAVGHVKRKGKITNKEYQQLNDVSKKTATRDLTELVRKGIFIGSGVKGAGAFYKLKLEGP